MTMTIPPNPSASEATPQQPLDAPAVIFVRVVMQAQTIKLSTGMLTAKQYTDSGGDATYTHNKFKLKPSKSDFVCDVEITAKKCLVATPNAFRYFMRAYFEEFLPIEKGDEGCFVQLLERYPVNDRETIRAYDKAIRRKLGTAFKDVGLYPYDVYMNVAGMDMRINNKSRDDLFGGQGQAR